MVDGPSGAERQLKALKAAGTSAGAIFFAVGAKAFNAPEITALAVEKIKEKKNSEDVKNSDASTKFLALQTNCKETMEWMNMNAADYHDLSQAERVELIGYVFKARGDSGVTKHTTNSTAALQFLDALAPLELVNLLLDPPCLKGTGRVAKGMAEPALAELAPPPLPPSLLLMPPPSSGVLTGFEDLTLDMKGLVPLEKPPWMDECCLPDHETAGDMVGLKIIFKWPPRMGGWAMGEITSVADPQDKVEKERCNFKVFYASDGETANHRLMPDKYALSSKSPLQSWALLGQQVNGP